METLFTEAKDHDIPIILEMMGTFNAIDDYPFDPETRYKNLSELMGNPGLGSIFLIRNQECIIGYIVLTFGYSFEYQGRDAFIDEFFIKEDFRNRGIGKTTLGFIERASEKLGINAIHLEVENHNVNANSLYLNKGFIGNQRTLLTKKIKTES
ncbi:MAG: GNAT family N-acetyltransferase [Saonia sp.]